LGDASTLFKEILLGKKSWFKNCEVRESFSHLHQNIHAYPKIPAQSLIASDIEGMTLK
jgi:hypothetical protein